ncbi:MAG: alpha/beta fold hydrolase [Anaerolineae bacterium]
METYLVDGQEIRVHEEGKGRATAILIHGWSSSWFAMSPLLPYLSQRYRCLAVDLPGFGESPKLPERATFPRYAELIGGLIEQVAAERPVMLVGHSMGGMISVMVAKNKPDLLERMILLCPTISGDLALLIDLLLLPFVTMERFPPSNALGTALEPLVGITDSLMRPALFADRSRISEEDFERIIKDARRRDQGRVRAECFQAMRENDLRGKIGEIDVPTMIIWGMEDNTVPLRDASVVAEEWPEADLRIIPNAGHWPHFETPTITERYIRAFVSTPAKLLNFEL